MRTTIEKCLNDILSAGALGVSERDKQSALNDAACAVAGLAAHLAEWESHGRCLLAAHRGQLPSEAADLYGGGCGCPQCAEVLALLKGPNVEFSGERSESVATQGSAAGGSEKE